MSSATPIPTHRQIPAAMLAEMDELLAETDLFEHRGSLYYRHESGIIFTASIYEIANTPPDRAPPRRTIKAIPELAVPYDLPPGSTREARTDAWTNACDRLAAAPLA